MGQTSNSFLQVRVRNLIRMIPQPYLLTPCVHRDADQAIVNPPHHTCGRQLKSLHIVQVQKPR